jgi:ABC-type sugar transport system ATPase subunit
MDHPRLELRNIVKTFDGTIALNSVNLLAHRGEFLSLLGPSGCGKSTLLSVITGLVRPDSGDVCVDGRVVSDVAPQRRRLGLVFQDYAVFSRHTVRQNLAFGLEAHHVNRRERERRIGSVAEKLALGTLLALRGSALNMSEMQRVAIARVLVTEPEVLLLDEPMSNLDASLRTSLRTELKTIQTELGQTVLYVTHDQSEAMAMSDRIAVMRAGEILQVGAPEEIYRRPATRFVAEFIGDPPMNIVPCEVLHSGTDVAVKTALHGPLSLPGIAATQGKYLLGIRPHDVLLARTGGEGTATATVRFVENLGAEHIIYVQYGDRLLAMATRPGIIRVGDSIAIAFRSGATHLIDERQNFVQQPRQVELDA